MKVDVLLTQMARSISLPDKKDYGYELAYKLACEKLAQIDDIERQCLNSGASCEVKDSKKVITLEYLNQHYQITLPDIEILLKDQGEEVRIREKILILHYFTQAKGAKLSNKIITYKELPSATNYVTTFTQRAIKPLVDNFGKEPDRLLNVVQALGGRKADYGDVAVTINAFSRVPITLVLWQGDEEFPPNGNIFFDSSIPDYLTLDDINVLCETIAWRLVRLKGKR